MRIIELCDLALLYSNSRVQQLAWGFEELQPGFVETQISKTSTLNPKHGVFEGDPASRWCEKTFRREVFMLTPTLTGDQSETINLGSV